MTKYLEKSFNSPANNKAYSDNYDRIFGKKCKPLMGEHVSAVWTTCDEEGCVDHYDGWYECGNCGAVVDGPDE